MTAASLILDRDGAEHVAGLVDEPVLKMLEGLLSAQMDGSAGRRLFGLPGLADTLGPAGLLGAVAGTVLGGRARPVRAILFDRTARTNWSLAWHQDRVIAVQRRVEVEGFGSWSRKHGALHVAPPLEILSRMLTVRLHLDAVAADNAPLLVAPGSHRLGRIAEPGVPGVVERCGVAACLAERGDGWLYSTPILHASERAARPVRRRVLQVDLSADDLPGGLQWFGVA